MKSLITLIFVVSFGFIQVKGSVRLAFIIVIHIAACCFYYTGYYDLNINSRNTWIVVDGLAKKVGESVVFLKPLSMRYIRALYWSVISLVTTGFGDIGAKTILESFVALIFFFCGYLIVGILIGIVSNLVSISSSAENAYYQKLDELSMYMTYRKLPDTLKVKK